MTDSERAASPPAHLQAAAAAQFGPHLDLAVRFAQLLVTDGLTRGLLGPREAPKMWDRHLLNCAAVSPLIPPDARVIDVGSGAGLPGIVLAIARPDISVILVEPLARRTAFLTEVVAALSLDRTTVVRARAEECKPGRGRDQLAPADVVTARAVAPLDRLAGWCLPLTVVGGRVLALKGETAAEEIATHGPQIGRLGGGRPTLRTCVVGDDCPPTTVIEIVRAGSRHAAPVRPARPQSDSRRPGR